MTFPRFARAGALLAVTLLVGCSHDATDDGDTSADALSMGDLAAAYAKQTVVDLGPGVHAVLGKGGNSVVIEDDETLVFDTKFGTTWPLDGAQSLHRWIGDNVSAPVTSIVNSHYHYDHTWGNALYPGAEVYAHADSRALMLAVDPETWGTESQPRVGLPTKTLEPITIIPVGKRSVEVHLAGRGHTAGDAWLRIPRASLGPSATSDVIATGDLVFNTYYPFFDEDNDGSSLAGDIQALHDLTQAFPDARFVPGHGPVCNASDIEAYATYLQEMLDAIRDSIAEGLDEDGAVRRVGPSRWKRLILPSPHHGIAWATAESSFRAAFRIVKKQGNGAR
ncbi:Cyclase [Labilithrix luteola]|uniref:Cyclase n=1 Tax=Labilithrix luteola TaxID=1391654 RepID=A0A0K1Q0I2_9BACT|nr:MBL fold metallo-hydrolase [Labilithrix luteola]AKU99280.1 Cyclase [Labilithrix luteola]